MAGAAALALSGCDAISGLDPARAPTASAHDPSVPAHGALVALRARLDAASASDLTDDQAALIAWALSVNDDQHAATSLEVPTAVSPPPSSRPPSSPTPSWRPPSSPTPSSPTPSARTPSAPAPDAASPFAALATGLADAEAAFDRQAQDSATARPLTWASMAAWCAGVRAELPEPHARREPARGFLQPAPQTVDEAAQSALDAASTALYGVQVAAGQPALDAADRARLATRLAFWTNLRDALDTLARAASVTPAPAPPWFEARRPSSAEEAFAMVARVQAAALPILGRSLAHGGQASRAKLGVAIADLAVDIPRWGGLLERWPGLPIA